MTVNEYNYAQLRQTANALRETAKHNRAMEAVEQGKLAETQRHQMVSESIDQSKVDESIRHDSAMESIQRQSNMITDWYNRTRSAQEQEKLGYTGQSTSAGVAKTTAEADKLRKETQYYDRRAEADIYSTYTQANASQEKSAAYTRNAATNEFNAKVNAVLNTGKWITGTITDLGGLLTKSGYAKPKSDDPLTNTGSGVDPNATKEIERDLKGKGYWYD